MNDQPIGASHVADVAYDFCRYYMAGSDGCRNCGGLPHTTECFVGRFVVALGLDTLGRRPHSQHCGDCDAEEFAAVKYGTLHRNHQEAE